MDVLAAKTVRPSRTSMARATRARVGHPDPWESHLALAALGSMRAGDNDAVTTLQLLLRRVQPTNLRRIR